MLNAETVRLAPLYDLVTYAPYWDGETRLNSAMNVDGEYALSRISVAKLVAAGKQFGLAGEAEDIVQSIRTGMLDAFEVARTSIDSNGPDAARLADELMAGLIKMPLVLND
jgi:serine/threonine-protein kinase HipA